MSHVATIDIEVTDLGTLAAAAKRLGMELVQGQKTYRWFAGRQGDCEHAVRIPGDNKAYEIGVVKRTDGRLGYAWNGIHSTVRLASGWL